MKFLVIGKNKPYALPQPSIDAYKGALTYTENGLSSGRFDCAYSFLEGGGFVIGDASSAEDIFTQLASYPLYAYFDWQVIPIIKTESGINLILQKLETALA